MWFDSWSQLARSVGSAAVAYVLLIVLLRSSGRRTLSTLNAFDFVVTVALGSTLATIALSSEVTVAQGFAVLAALIGLQYVVAWSAARRSAVRTAVKSEPVVVVVDGTLLEERLREQRLAPEDVRQAIRSAGVGGVELVAAVVLETDGTLSVVTHERAGSKSAFADVNVPGRLRR